MTDITVQRARLDGFTEEELEVIRFGLQQVARRVMDKAAADEYHKDDLAPAAMTFHLASTLAGEFGVKLGEPAPSAESLEMAAGCIAEGGAPLAVVPAAEVAEKSEPPSYEDTHIDESDAARISALLVGRTVEKVADDRLLLDDGTELQVVPNDGGCSCGAGDYELTALNGCENVITRAEVVVENKNPDDSWDEEKAYRLFVYADNQKINLVTVEGDDGNGYYGTGFEIVVRPVASPSPPLGANADVPVTPEEDA